MLAGVAKERPARNVAANIKAKVEAGAGREATAAG
jgi:hypothetical protein